MSILDLQGMSSATTPTLAAKSSTSKDCGNTFGGGGKHVQSNVSLLLCIVIL
jgi:hypothetical protein